MVEVVASSLLAAEFRDVVMSATQCGLPVGPLLRAMSRPEVLVLRECVRIISNKTPPDGEFSQL